MSELHLTDRQTKKFPTRGDTDFLSPEEHAFVQRILSRVESFPEAFWSGIIQKVALDGLPIPQSQVQGLAALSVRFESIPTDESTSSTSSTNLSTVGPVLAGLGSGLYIFMFGCTQHATATPEHGYAGISVNSATPFAAESLVLWNDPVNTFTTATQVVTRTLTDANNSVALLYKTDGATVFFRQRFLIAIRYGNA